MERPSLQPRRVCRAALAVVVGALAVTALAEPVTLHQDVDVKSDKNPLADPVETVGSGGQLERLSTEGSWVRVRTAAGKEGYVSTDELVSTVYVSGVSGSSQVSGVAAAAAGRGNQPGTLSDDAKTYAQGKNLSTDGLKQMLTLGNGVKSGELRSFAQEGHVGPKKFRK